MADFSDLLQEAEKLTADLEGTADLPRVDRSLRQVLEASNDLYARVAQSGAKDIQANLLLGSKGIDLPKIVQKLEAISTKRTFEPIEPLDDLDISGMLENEIRNRVLETFEAGYNDMLASASDFASLHQTAEWKGEKRKILAAMSGHAGAFLEPTRPLTVVMQNGQGGTKSSPHLDPVQAVYAAKIMEYNAGVNRGGLKWNLIDVFEKVSADFKDAKIKDMWEIMKYMTQAPRTASRGEDAIKNRTTPSAIENLVAQAKKYLEDRYKTYMSCIVNENLSMAERGGIPGTVPLVRSFVGLRLQHDYVGLQDGLVADRPFWPTVYYCLRCGDAAAAIYCLEQRGGEFGDLVAVLKARNAGADCGQLEEGLRLQYRRTVRNEMDPFKRIIWAVLSCCDVTDEHSEVARTADDYLWLKLSLVKVGDEREDSRIKYGDLQATILEEYGESYYDAGNQPHLYFQVLALTGQFEAAVEFLSRCDERYRVHGVHMAVALNELYLLGQPVDPAAPLMAVDPADARPSRRLNLARLLMIYVRNFELNCPNEALHYFFLLRNMTNAEGLNLFAVCVADLAIETRRYGDILGRVQPNGLRNRGLLDGFCSGSITTELVADIIGGILMRKGLYEEAVEVYDVANKREEVVRLMSTLLSQVVHQKSEEGNLRSRLQDKSRALASRYAQDNCKLSAGSASSFAKLTELLGFFDLYHKGQYQQALFAVRQLRLLPLEQQDVDECLKAFRGYSDELNKVLPDVMLATMNMLFDQYQKAKGGAENVPHRYGDGGRNLGQLRGYAKVLTNFAGMLPYRMPGDTNSRLVQMEILMH